MLQNGEGTLSKDYFIMVLCNYLKFSHLLLAAPSSLVSLDILSQFTASTNILRSLIPIKLFTD